MESSSIRDKALRLKKTIEVANRMLVEVQINCKHKRKLHKSSYVGETVVGNTIECYDCQCFISCWCMSILEQGKVTKKEWVEDV